MIVVNDVLIQQFDDYSERVSVHPHAYEEIAHVFSSNVSPDAYKGGVPDYFSLSLSIFCGYQQITGRYAGRSRKILEDRSDPPPRRGLYRRE